MGKREQENKNQKKVSDEEIDKIVERLHKTHTMSSKGGEGGPEAMKAQDIISKSNGNDVDGIVNRLYSTHTQAMQNQENQQLTARDTISKSPMQSTEVDSVVDRLYQAHTQSSSGGGPAPKICNNEVAKQVDDEAQIAEIFDRLQKTHTKSSAGGVDCKPWDPLKDPGYGTKMYTVVDGIETRFAGTQGAPADEELKVLNERMMNTKTVASQARLDNARILLYPERTTLMNNVERINAFQENGSVSKQNTLQRREKWFN